MTTLNKLPGKRTAVIAAALALCIATGTVSSALSNGKLRSKTLSGLRTSNVVSLNNTSELSVKDYSVPNALSEFGYEKEGYKNLYEKTLAEDGFIFGMDYDWFLYNGSSGKNMGDNQILGWKSIFNDYLTYIDLYNIKAMGYNCVNVWLFMQGEGLRFDDNGFVTGLDDTFKTNIVKVMNMCRELDLPICFSIQPHGEAENYGNGSDTENYIEIWNKYYQFYYREDARKAYMENAIRPLAEIIKGYQDVVMILDLTIENESNLTDDPELGYFDGGPKGTTWENFSAFLNDMNATIKSVIPNSITSTEDVGGYAHAYRKNEVNVDIIGMNNYNGNGQMGDPTEMYLVKPFYVGEFNGGESGFDQWSQEYWGKIKTRFYPDAIQKGYIGAFYFSYSTGGSPFSLFDGLANDYDGMRSYALSLSYQVKELINEHKGIKTEMDTPVLLCNKGGSDVYWIGGRGVSSYKLERSDDNGKTWKVIDANIDADMTSLTSGLCKYTDNSLAEGIDYCYRVTAYNDEGKSAVSKPNNVESFYVAKDLLIDGSFENTELKEEEKSEGWYQVSGAGSVTDEEAHTGKYCFKVDKINGINNQWGKTQQKLTVKPNTNYTLTFWYKAVKDVSMFSIRALDNDKKDIADYWSPAYDEEWKQATLVFTTGDYDTIYIRIDNGTGTKSVGYFDDFELKETR